MTCTRSAGFKARSHGKGLAEGRGDQVYRIRTAGASVGGGQGHTDVIILILITSDMIAN